VSKFKATGDPRVKNRSGRRPCSAGGGEDARDVWGVWGVYQVSVPRAETIRAMGIEVPPSMGPPAC